METQQLQQLKINSTNIKSSLISYNKQLRKLRLDENKLLSDKEKKSKLEDKEKRLEAPGKGLIENIKSRIIAGPMSFFDKVKEFFGIILIGVAINNLPAIVNKVSEVGKTLIDVANSVVEVITTTVNGINGFISIIQSLPETTKNKLIQGKDQLEQLILDMNKIIDPLNEQYTKFNKDLNSKSGSTPGPDQSNSPNPQSPSPQGKAKGGTILNNSSQKGSSTNKANVPKGGNADVKVTSSPFARPGGSAKLKQARQSYNAFGEFYTLTKDNKENYSLLGASNETFYEVNKSFETFLIQLRDLQPKQPPTTSINSPSSQPPIPTTGQSGTVPINTNDVVGTVGSTGRVTGPHIHIERVGDYSLGIPQNIKDNIMVEGIPMTQRLTPTDKIGNYSWRKSTANPTGLHKGEDWAGAAGQRITLTGGLKFIRFAPDSGSGYGNQVYIQAPDGSQYTLNHLDSGPANLQQLLQQQKRQQQIQQAPVSPYQVQPGQQGPVIPPQTSFLFEKEEDDVQIVMINTTQPIIQKGKTRTVVVNSGRKDPFSQDSTLSPLSSLWEA